MKDSCEVVVCGVAVAERCGEVVLLESLFGEMAQCGIGGHMTRLQRGNCRCCPFCVAVCRLLRQSTAPLLFIRRCVLVVREALLLQPHCPTVVFPYGDQCATLVRLGSVWPRVSLFLGLPPSPPCWTSMRCR